MPGCILQSDLRSSVASIPTHVATPFATAAQVALLGLFVVVTFVGCGRSEKKVTVYPVSGKISFEGKPPVGAQIVLNPVGAGEAGVTVAPVGTVKEDGSFQISTYGNGDGAPAGDYTATVQWFKLVAGDGGSGRGPNVLPPKYSKADLSPIKITVKSGTNEVPTIVIAN